jgi:phosphate transport system protein
MRTAYHDRLSALITQLADACDMTGRAVDQATHALLRADLQLAEQVILEHEDLRRITHGAEEEAFVLLALQAPVAGDLRTIVGCIHIAADVERMGGLAVHIAKIARRRHPRQAVPAAVNHYFMEMAQLALQLSTGASEVLLSRDPQRAKELRTADDAMNDMHRRLLGVLGSATWTYGIEAAVDVTLLGRFYERFADHAVGIARRVIFQATGRYDDEAAPQ